MGSRRVLDPCAGLLSNYEVFEFLKEKKASRVETKSARAPSSVGPLAADRVANVEDQYLSTTPAASQSAENIQEFLNVMLESGLTKAEKLQLINCRPKTMVEIYVIVEACEERLSEQHTEVLLSIVDRYFAPGASE
mmetsp:Transcript_24317/g.41846  ORF Transcript_24317/g.41846 Transcript_24317/m.41846 type:complete len:136 (+) Transcript_24317:24-431(+)